MKDRQEEMKKRSRVHVEKRGQESDIYMIRRNLPCDRGSMDAR